LLYHQNQPQQKTYITKKHTQHPINTNVNESLKFCYGVVINTNVVVLYRCF
jgi:hypothetical protein